MAGPLLKPGVVLVTRSKGGVRSGGWWIRLGAALQNKPNLQNHVAVVHHTDANGTTWCIEGRPGGAGWRDARGYINDKWTINNSAQPIPDSSGAAIAKIMESLIGTAYDWKAIAADGLADLGMKLPGWDQKWQDGEVNVQAVCSSLAAYAYGKANVAHPPGDRGTQPSDWCEWIVTRAWEAAK
jgi:hypothetical protein